MVDRSLSLCITTHNRDRMLFESFQNVLHDERIKEIVIVDDASEDHYYGRVKRHCEHLAKVKLFRNIENLGCYKNKAEAIKNATSEYVVIFDSDNVMTTEYIDKVFEEEWKQDVILAPDYVHSFDYRHFAGLVIDKTNVREQVEQPRFDCLINTMNYFVHRDNYLKVFDPTIEPWTADTITQNYNWLKAGFKIKVVSGMSYFHRIDHNMREEKSHYKIHVRKTGNLFNDMMKKLKYL